MHSYDGGRSDSTSETSRRIHPLAARMGVIAFLNQNITIACTYGTFSVLLNAVDTHLGVGLNAGAWGMPLINLATAGLAPIIGALATRYSLRVIMLVGSMLGLLGFVVLATTDSYPLYLLAYGLGLGPAMASVGVVLPASLVTRWFVFNRGKALGLVTVPLAITCMPLSATWMLHSYGLIATYWALAALCAVCVIANYFVVDRPPEEPQWAAESGASGPASIIRSALLARPIRSARFWMVAIASVASNTGAVILSASTVSIAGSWGLSPTQGASLLTMQTLGGLAGSIMFGWIADRLGGALALALLVFDCAILWAVLLVHPPYIAVAAILLVFGIHASGVLPVTGAVISELVGRDGFSRAYGLFNLVNLPFAFFCVPAAAAVFERTGSYDRVLLGQVVYFVLAIPLALTGRRRTLRA